MSRIAVLGAGAFGTALAVALAQGGAAVTLWARDRAQAEEMRATGRNDRRLPGIELPAGVAVLSDLSVVQGADVALLAMPMQEIAGFLAINGPGLGARALVGCAKGIDLATRLGPSALMQAACPSALAAVLTGPSFAADIARGMPTALTLACSDDAGGARLQRMLATPVLRLYRTDDVIGAEIGGAMKNVVAIAAGAVIAGNLGESARAAIVTRGFAEMVRLAVALGARAETLAGLSGLGDLVLTATSVQSRNFRFGMALGEGAAFDPGVTVEGAATARAAVALGGRLGIEMPVAEAVTAMIDGRLTLAEAADALLTRPLRKE